MVIIGKHIKRETIDRRPREGQRRYYADDIETYTNGKWISKEKSKTYVGI